MYTYTMKKKNPTHRGIENKPYIEAMRELRRSNAATTHDNRPNRLRTRKAIKAQAIRENEQFDVGGLGYNSNTNKGQEMLSYGQLTDLVLETYSQVYPTLYATDGTREAQVDIGKIFYNLADDDLILLVEKAVREYADSKGVTV